MEQASPFPRINTPPPGGSRGSNSPTFSSGAESPSCDDVRQPLLSQHETSSDPQPANSKSNNNNTTHPPPGFSGNSQPSTSSSSAGARGLIHPGSKVFNLEHLNLGTTVVGLSPLGKSEPIDIPPATFQSTAQSSNKTSNSQTKAIVSQSGSTATTTTTSSHSNTLSTTNHSSSSSNTAAANPGHFPFNDFGGLGSFLQMQGMQSMHGISNQWPNQEAYEKFMQAKKRKDKRAKKNENKNVIAQVKAEEVDGYCGEKSINDLLESLGEVSTETSGGANDIDKKKGKKGEKSSKDKRDKRRQNKAATNNGVTSSNGSADSNDVTDNEEPMEVEEIQEIEVKETRETTKEKKKKSAGMIENGFEMNHNVYLVTAEDNLKNSENLAASTDSLNFVPVTGKRRGKKIKEEQEKEKLMKDNNKGKSREDNVRPTSASGGSVQSGPGGYGGNRTAGGSAGGQDSGSTRPGNRQTAGQDTRRTSNYSLRSREVQINTEPEKSAVTANGEASAAVTLNHGPDDFPALNPIQDFPALSVQQAPTTDKPHIHSAWAARKPSASSTTGGGSLSAPNLPQQQQQATPSNAAVNATTGAPSGEVPNYTTATNKAVAGGGDDNPNYQQDQPSKCDKLSVNKSNDTSANKTVDDVFASNAAATTKNVTSIGNAKKDKAPAGTSPNEDNSRSVNNVKKVCDNKSFVSENAKDNNNIDCEVSVSDNVMITPSNTSAAATIINTNPLLSDDGVVNIDFNDTSNAAVASNNDLDYDGASYNSMGYIAMGDDYSCHQMPPPANMNGQDGSRFEFDTRTASGSVVGSEAGGPLSLAPEEGELSFGFDINYQLIDASLTTTTSNSTTPTQDIINRGENIKENALTETGSPPAPNGAYVVASTPADIGHPTAAAAAGGNFNNIASLDKAIVSFSTAEGAMIVGGYHFMNTNIPPPFATNCIPVMPQMDPTGTPMDGRHHQPSGEPKEVVSPESGICSPLSWQGDGEDLAANTNTASPPLQPGSYPRRQDNRDFISELKKLNYQQLRGGSSRSPSPSARSGSAGSYTNNQHRRAAADLSFPRSDDSGLNTSNRRDMLNSEGGSIVNSPSPNHCEIVSFLQNNWEEFSKDKKVKVYGEKKEQQRR